MFPTENNLKPFEPNKIHESPCENQCQCLHQELLHLWAPCLSHCILPRFLNGKSWLRDVACVIIREYDLSLFFAFLHFLYEVVQCKNHSKSVWGSAGPQRPLSPPSPPVVQNVSTWSLAVSLVKFCKCGCILISLRQSGELDRQIKSGILSVPPQTGLNCIP